MLRTHEVELTIPGKDEERNDETPPEAGPDR
jgi:hypothetical protein